MGLFDKVKGFFKSKEDKKEEGLSEKDVARKEKKSVLEVEPIEEPEPEPEPEPEDNTEVYTEQEPLEEPL